MARTVLLAAPFLVAGGLVYLWLLTEFDINYYLTEHPPEFWIAAILIAIVVGAMALVLARFFINWAFTLPLVLFEDVGEREIVSAEPRARRSQSPHDHPLAHRLGSRRTTDFRSRPRGWCRVSAGSLCPISSTGPAYWPSASAAWRSCGAPSICW